MWISYDTENQKIFLKKLLKNVSKIKMKSIPKVKGLKTIFVFIKEFGMTCQPMNTAADIAGKPKSRNLSVNWYDMSIREKERQMGQFNWTIVCPKLIIRFQKDGGSNFTDRDCLNFIWKGSKKTRFQYCQNLCNTLLYLRAIQGHTGEMIPPEMLCHVFIHHNWKEFVFHRGCSFNLTSILNTGLIAGGREGRETRHTVFFTPLNP